MKSKSINWLIIAAGGKGQRTNLGFNKIFSKINNHPLLYWTLKTFEKSDTIDNIIISATKSDILKINTIIKKYKFKKVVDVIEAQLSRQLSTYQILKIYKSQIKNDDLVGVHNAANPFVTQLEIKQVFFAAKNYKAALLAYPAKDTVKITNKKGFVANTPLRQFSWYAQTPQVAVFKYLYKAHHKANTQNFIGTDDAQFLERIGIKPKIVHCSYKNFKITFPEDLILAKQIIKSF